ncbi:MAG TPA: AI-2E family transporter YdiK [Casimicrobiaceae bacterium]|jgi:predicted PurR-regulated permease PerM|nr:AI-2E family transporter YdiK [Casimicrobiaceae bacterium]
MVRRPDLTRIVLAVLLMGILISGSFWILRPFLLSTIWAAMIVVATWPLMLRLQARLGRRGLAVAIMSTAMVLVFVAPLLLAIQTLVDNTDTITRWIRGLATSPLPPPPDWLSRIPLLGTRIADYWSSIAGAEKGELASRLAPYTATAAAWLAGALGSFGLLGIQFLLTVVVAVILYTRGEAAREAMIRFGGRLAGDRGKSVVLLAGQAIRAVALGVVVTALVQTVLAGIGLAVAGVPFAGLLTGVILLLCIAQIGPIIVLVPAVIWLFWNDAQGWGTALAIWTVIVGALDNILRPLLIRRGADLPLLLIFAGVIGGLLAFGIIGLFVGPVVLAVSYTLFNEWVREEDRS